MISSVFYKTTLKLINCTNHKSNIIVMNKSNDFIPLNNQAQQNYIRGRNFSLSLPKQLNCNSPNAQKNPLNFINSSLIPLSYQSKQKHLLLRYSKLKKNRDPTKITQQNMQKYMFLKSKVTSFKKKQVQNISRSPQQKSSSKQKMTKCSVRLLTIPINCPILLKKYLLNSERCGRTKSQPNKRDQINYSQFKKYPFKQKKSIENPIKRYNQLSLQQIVGNDEDSPNRNHFLNKINQLRSKIQHNLWFASEANTDEHIRGW